MIGREVTAANGSSNDLFAALRQLIEGAENIVALTGAGISTESGIPDFRSPGGIWTRLKPITYQDFLTSEEARLEDWRRRFKMNAEFARAEPNAGHLGLTALARGGRLRSVITQNIDGLHQRSGLPADKLIELHGNATRGRCLDCGEPMPLATVHRLIVAEAAAPRCGCGGLVKAAIVAFGERIPAEAMARATELARTADVFLVIGSSLQVQPAASLPVVAARAGAEVVVINRDPTPLDGAAALILREPIGTVFSGLFPQIVH